MDGVRYAKVPNKDDAESAEALLQSGASSEDEIEFIREATSGKTYTVEDAIENIGCGKTTIGISFLIGSLSVADAMEMMLLTVLSNALRCDWSVSDMQVASITTMVFIGMGSTGPIWGYISDKYGRRKTLVLCTMFVGSYGVLSGFSPNYTWMLILRGLVGASIGGTPQGFVHQVEFIPSKWRPLTVNVGQLFWFSGTIFEITLASIVIPTIGWRWLIVFSSIPVLIASLTNYFLLPESARYLITAGQRLQAKEVLQRVARGNKGPLPDGDLKPSPKLERGRFRDLFSAEYARTSVIVLMLWFCAAFCYYGLVLATSDILEKHHDCEGPHIAKHDSEGCVCTPLTQADYRVMILSTLGELAGIPVCSILLHFMGRRRAIASSLFLGAAFFASTSFCMSRTLLTFCLFGARLFTSIMFLFIYLYTSEVYPTSIRSIAVGTGSGTARIGGIVTPYVAQVLLDWSIKSAVGTYTAVCLVCCIAALLLPIETKGRHLKNVVNEKTEEPS